MLATQGGSSRARGCGLRDIGIYGNPNVTALSFTYCGEVQLERVRIQNCGKALYLNDVVQGWGHGLKIDANFDVGIHAENQVNAFCVRDSRIQATKHGPNVIIDGGYCFTIEGGAVESSGVNTPAFGIEIGPTRQTQQVTIQGVHMENNALGPIRVGKDNVAASNANIIGNWMVNGQQNATVYLDGSDGTTLFGNRWAGNQFITATANAKRTSEMATYLASGSIGSDVQLSLSPNAASKLLGVTVRGNMGDAYGSSEGPTRFRAPSGQNLSLEAPEAYRYSGNSVLSNGTLQVVFSVPMPNASYGVLAVAEDGSPLAVSSKSANGFTITGSTASRIAWRASR